jgi:hypothetical protein
LIKRGWLERTVEGKQEVYGLTPAGNQFAVTKMTPRFPRTRGEKIMAGLIERAEAINARSDLCCSVSTLRLFGSMLDRTSRSWATWTSPMNSLGGSIQLGRIGSNGISNDSKCLAVRAEITSIKHTLERPKSFVY